MPVEKADGAELRKTRVPYEIIPRATVDAIQSAEALAIWVYLITKPEDWVARKSDIMGKLKLGADRYGKAIAELKELGLIEAVTLRTEDGKMAGRRIIVKHSPRSSTEVPENRTSGIPEAREIRTLKDTDSKSITKADKGEKRKRFVAPRVDEVKSYCEERDNGIDPEAFIDHYESKGWMVGKNRMKDWKAAVRNWERSRKNDTTEDNPYGKMI